MRSSGIARSIDAPRLHTYFLPGVVVITCDPFPANGTGWHAGSGAPAGETSRGLPEYPRLDFCAASRHSAAAACSHRRKIPLSDAHVCQCGPIAVQGHVAEQRGLQCHDIVPRHGAGTVYARRDSGWVACFMHWIICARQIPSNAFFESVVRDRFKTLIE